MSFKGAGRSIWSSLDRGKRAASPVSSVCVCVCDICMHIFFYCHTWRHDLRVTPHTPADTHRLTLNTHAPGWAGHWCMCTPDMLPTCTSVTCTHHGVVSTRTCFLPLPLMCFLAPLPMHTHAALGAVVRKNLLGVECMSKSQQTEQYRSARKATADTSHMQERAGKHLKMVFVDIFYSHGLYSRYTHCDTYCL